MRQARERLDRRFHDPVTRQVIEIGNEAEATAVPMQGRIQQVIVRPVRHAHRRDRPMAVPK